MSTVTTRKEIETNKKILISHTYTHTHIQTHTYIMCACPCISIQVCILLWMNGHFIVRLKLTGLSH